MIGAAKLLRNRRPGLQFAAAMANPRIESVFRRAMHEAAFEQITVIDRRPRRVMAAADVVLCASGTATLEAMLVNRPLIMTYRIARSTYLLAKHLRLIRPQRFALPNILAGEGLVPELIQQDACADRMAAEVERWLDDPQAVATLRHRFDALHAELRCDASSRAAKAVAKVLGRGQA